MQVAYVRSLVIIVLFFTVERFKLRRVPFVPFALITPCVGDHRLDDRCDSNFEVNIFKIVIFAKYETSTLH